MVQTLLIALLFSLSAHAQLFGFGSNNKFNSNIPGLAEKIRKLPMKAGPQYEETFNNNIKQIENALEEEKLFCAGEAADTQGKTLAPAQKELCFRELKKHYLEAMNVVFNLKKQYLGLLHTQHLEELSEIQRKLTSTVEKSF